MIVWQQLISWMNLILLLVLSRDLLKKRKAQNITKPSLSCNKYTAEASCKHNLMKSRLKSSQLVLFSVGSSIILEPSPPPNHPSGDCLRSGLSTRLSKLKTDTDSWMIHGVGGSFCCCKLHCGQDGEIVTGHSTNGAEAGLRERSQWWREARAVRLRH